MRKGGGMQRLHRPYLWHRLGVHVPTPLWLHLPPPLLLTPAPELPSDIPSHMPTGLEQRWCSSQRATGIHEVHRLRAPAIRISVELRGVCAPGVLDPGLTQLAWTCNDCWLHGFVLDELEPSNSPQISEEPSPLTGHRSPPIAPAYWITEPTPTAKGKVLQPS